MRTQKTLITISIICIILAILGTIALVYSVQAAPAGWFGTCRVAPSIEHTGELYRVRCGNGEIRQVDGVLVEIIRPTAIVTRTPNPTWMPDPYPMPTATQPNPYP